MTTEPDVSKQFDKLNDVLRGRWTLAILWLLLSGPRRFGELAELLPDISARVLTYQLRRLVEYRLIVHHAVKGNARIRVYELSDYGVTLRPLLDFAWYWTAWYSERRAAEPAWSEETRSQRAIF